MSPAVTATPDAIDPSAPRTWEQAGSNVWLDADSGDGEATEAAFARAAHVVRFQTTINRVTGVTMEPRAAVCEFDPASQHYTLYAGSGGAVRLKDDLAKVSNVPESNVRVVMYDIGGNFGTRGMIYPEFCAVAWAARRIGRPDAIRAVGAANGANPIPIVIPCHRVIGMDGRLVGFGGGLDVKKRLLMLESGQQALI